MCFFSLPTASPSSYLPGSYGFTSPYWNGYSTFPIYFAIDQASKPASPPASTEVSFRKSASGDDYSGFLASADGRKILGRFEGIVLQELRRGFPARMIFGSTMTTPSKGRIQQEGALLQSDHPREGSCLLTVNLRLAKTESGNYKLEGNRPAR